MGELVKAAEALSAPATKLIEVVSRGIGRAYDPRYKKRMTDAAVYEIDALADAVRRNNDLPLLIDRFGVQLDARSVQELAERTQMRLCSQEMRKQQNIEAIVDKAYEEIQKETVVSSEPVDDDWITRFFNCVEDVSSQELQRLWALVLAGEIRKPRSTSLRTLEILKNITQQEATVFSQLTALSIRMNNRRLLITENYDVIKECNIKFDDLRLLDECGLLFYDVSSAVESVLTNRNVLEMSTDSLYITVFCNRSEPIPFRIKCMQFTIAGKELMDSLNIVSDSEKIIKLLKSIGYDHSIFNLSAHPIRRTTSGLASAYMNEDLLNPN